jgi:hypothetical protein
MHIERLHVRLAERHRAAVLARFDPATCYARLRELAAALDGHPWMVVSGLAEPLTNGGISRAHSDIDIAIPRDALEVASAAALARGFVLTTRIFRTHLSASLDVEAHLRIDAAAAARRPRHLRLWRFSARGTLDESAVPAYIDVFPYLLSDRKLWILDSGQQLELRRPLVVQASLPDGTKVPVEDPYYVEALRCQRRQRPVHGFDADEPTLAAPGERGQR